MFKRFDRTKIKTRPLAKRKNKIFVKDIKLPKIETDRYYDPELDQLVKDILTAHRKGKQIILSMGAHPIKLGYSKIFIDLMESGLITHLATNGAVAIHDFELAYIGATSEDVEKNIKDGSFGLWDEPGNFMNQAAEWGASHNQGLGETIGQFINQDKPWPMPHKDISIFAAAHRLKIPATIHKQIGCDITDEYPNVNFSALGQTSGIDFDIHVNSISNLQNGVFVCVGSQIMAPEVYLKSLSMARNVATQKGKKINKFTTAVFDNHDLGNWRNDKNVVNYKNEQTLKNERYYYRPMKSILVRTIKDGGKSFYIKGDFNDTLPIFHHRLTKK
ncbi:MAG: hypothetical protein KBC81_02930 [Candidatus Pacebacteria bacterium]|nr:hypothetical protein [Candidatus Paceibacterota bacterium]